RVRGGGAGRRMGLARYVAGGRRLARSVRGRRRRRRQAMLLANTVAMLAGTATSNARTDVAAKIASIDKTASSRLKLLGPGTGELFSGLPLGTSDPNLTTSFEYLYEMALATRTPGSAMVDDTDLQHRVIDGLSWLYDNYYGDQSAGYYGQLVQL